MEKSFSRVFLFMLAGPIVWAGHFLFIYIINGIACARPGLYRSWFGAPASSWIIAASSVLALAVMFLIYRRFRTYLPCMGDPAFLTWLARALGLLSAVAIIWETFPVFLLPNCWELLTQ